MDEKEQSINIDWKNGKLTIILFSENATRADRDRNITLLKEKPSFLLIPNGIISNIYTINREN